MKYTKYTLLLTLIFSLLITGNIYSQEEKDKSPVYSPWACSILIDNQTVSTPEKGLMELTIHHRFSRIEKISDLLGIYGPSNIRLGLSYGITDKLMIGIGTEKDNKLQELQWKYNIFPQTESGSMPVALTYFGNAVLDARNKDVFGEGYKFTNRMSYFHQLIVGRKFTEKISFQVAGGYAHFNSVDSVNFNDYLGIHAGGRYKFYNEISFIAEFDHSFPLSSDVIPYYKETPKPNYAFGLEFATGTHAFQVFAAQYRSIVNQKNLGYNLYDLTSGDWFLGFNITVRFY